MSARNPPAGALPPSVGAVYAPGRPVATAAGRHTTETRRPSDERCVPVVDRSCDGPDAPPGSAPWTRRYHRDSAVGRRRMSPASPTDAPRAAGRVRDDAMVIGLVGL